MAISAAPPSDHGRADIHLLLDDFLCPHLIQIKQARRR
jgi:hypothetical protein